jgi:hypothetical protein
MNGDRLEEHSGTRHEIVRSAIKAAFGSIPIDIIARVTGGATTALNLQIRVGDRHYLVRVEGEPSPLRNPFQYTSMRIAAESGIAPKIHYLDEAARVAVMDFVVQRPLREYPGGQPALARALGELLKRVQDTPLFPYFIDYPDIVARLFAHVRRTGLFAPGLLDAHAEHLERVKERYVSGLGKLVSSHNDFHPGNILFDGRRLWLIDWESAYRNDPLVDAAIAIDSFAFSAELEGALLRTWLGHTPDHSLRHRMETIRALTRLYFAGVFLSASAAARTDAPPDPDLSTLTVAEFAHGVSEGTLELAKPETKHIIGKAYLASFLSGEGVPGFGPVIR